MSLKKPFVFKHLTQTECPECKSRVRSCSIDGEHCSGEQFETVTFDCGCVIDYVPNFSRTEIRKGCPNGEKGKRIKLIRSQLTKSIQRAVDRQNLTSVSKGMLMNKIIDVLRFAEIKEKE